MGDYGTHQKYLKECILKTSGNILEFGCGDYSTKFILDLIKDTNRKLISVENNLEWYLKISQTYLENENHKYIFTTNYQKTCEELKNQMYSVVFIDGSPWETRITALKNLKENAEYIIIHDADYFTRRGLLNYHCEFKNFTLHTELNPPTLVAKIV